MIDDSLLITKTQVSDKLMEIFLKCVPIVSCPSIFEIHLSECQCCVISVLHSPDMKHFNRSCSSKNLSNQKSLPQGLKRSGEKSVSLDLFENIWRTRLGKGVGMDLAVSPPQI